MVIENINFLFQFLIKYNNKYTAVYQEKMLHDYLRIIFVNLLKKESCTCRLGIWYSSFRTSMGSENWILVFSEYDESVVTCNFRVIFWLILEIVFIFSLPERSYCTWKFWFWILVSRKNKRKSLFLTWKINYKRVWITVHTIN